MSESEHVVSHYPGALLPCWCEPGVYHCTPEDWEASKPEREAWQAVMRRISAALEAELDRAVFMGGDGA